MVVNGQLPCEILTEIHEDKKGVRLTFRAQSPLSMLEFIEIFEGYLEHMKDHYAGEIKAQQELMNSGKLVSFDEIRARKKES